MAMTDTYEPPVRANDTSAVAIGCRDSSDTLQNLVFTQTGATATVTAPPHSPSLGAGAAVTLGFTANGAATAPSAVTLNQAAYTT